MLFNAVVGNSPSSKAAIAENIHVGLLNLGDPCMKGDKANYSMWRRILIVSSICWIPSRNLWINDANQDLAKGSIGTALELKQSPQGFVKQFSYVLGQRISQITQNKSPEIVPNWSFIEDTIIGYSN